ncbi:MAG TPA: hypothetical protein VMT86_02610 [Bryobacteraceae bacterium]|nr:hypothetical protein [Bryobacteraceae bacterium]
MTTDERLEKLAERHEALAETVQILASMQLEAGRQAREHDAEYAQRFAANETRLVQLMDTMNRLGRILEVHDAEIDDQARAENLER